MIVVIGSAACRLEPDGAGRAVGMAPEIAAAAAAAGATVEILARVGEDGAGDELLLALARSGVGHLAVLRDPGRPTALAAAPPEDAVLGEDDLVQALLAEEDAAATLPAGVLRVTPGGLPVAPVLEPADLSLGLRYLRDFRVVVAVEPIADDGAAVVAEAASFGDAALVVVTRPGAPVPGAYAAATLLEAPVDDEEGAFARLVGRYAAALDRGVAPGEAFRSAAVDGGWQVAGA